MSGLMGAEVHRLCDLEDQALQIKRLRHCQQNGMVRGLSAPFQNTQSSSRIERSFRDNFQQHGFTDVM